MSANTALAACLTEGRSARILCRSATALPGLLLRSQQTWADCAPLAGWIDSEAKPRQSYPGAGNQPSFNLRL